MNQHALTAQRLSGFLTQAAQALEPSREGSLRDFMELLGHTHPLPQGDLQSQGQQSGEAARGAQQGPDLALSAEDRKILQAFVRGVFEGFLGLRRPRQGKDLHLIGLHRQGLSSGETMRRAAYGVRPRPMSPIGKRGAAGSGPRFGGRRRTPAALNQAQRKTP